MHRVVGVEPHMRHDGSRFPATPYRAILCVLCAVTVNLCLIACNDSDLVVVPLPPEAYLKQTIKAQVCAPETVRKDDPYKILFVVDTSLSNVDTDPTNRRAAAVRQTIYANQDKPSISFGLITFANSPSVATLSFTRDLNRLEAALSTITTDAGTNYADTLVSVQTFILNDRSFQTAADLRRTHYIVFWVSDGAPTVGIRDSEAIIPGVSAIRESMRTEVAEITFNTLFLYKGDLNSPALATAKGLLASMAAAGGPGTFTPVAPDADLSFTFTIGGVERPFSLRYVIANNKNARLHHGEPAPDSDGDGLADALEEESYETDPFSADSDTDGYSDGLELLVPGRLHPTGFDPGCNPAQALKDSDNDGLNDCEETVLGTSPITADSDGDWMPDGLEVQLGTWPLSNDPVVDSDLDQIADQSEAFYHLEPHVPTDDIVVSHWAYTYGLSTTVATNSINDRACYSPEVTNVWMAETEKITVGAASTQHPKGGNFIELIAAFTTDDASDGIAFRRAVLRGLLVDDGETQSPPTGMFEPGDGDFETFGQP